MRSTGQRSLAMVVFTLGLIISARRANAQYTISVNANNTHQVIDGFGAAQTWTVGSQLYSYGQASSGSAANAEASLILDMAFSRTKGIGLTILRNQVRPGLETSLNNYNPASDPEGVWMMQQAATRGPIKNIASVWSPPAWMKTNGATQQTCSGGSNNGAVCVYNTDCPGGTCFPGSLIDSDKQAYADYLNYYATTFASTNGVNIYAVSIQNEPDTYGDGIGWDTCVWSSAQFADFLANYLAPTFSSHGASTKVITPEPSNWGYVEQTNTSMAPWLGVPFMASIYGNSYALTRVDIVGSHEYIGDYTVPFSTALSYGKHIWQTEAADLWDDDPNASPTYCMLIGCAQSYVSTINKGLTLSSLSAWLWWELTANNGTPGSSSLIGPGGSPGYVPTAAKVFWAIGNFSRFVRPGYVRVDATTAAPYVDVSAYKDPISGQFVLVVNNRNPGSITLSFSGTGLNVPYATPWVTSATLSLAPQRRISFSQPFLVPGSSVVTYVAQSTSDLIWTGPDGAVTSWMMNANGTVIDSPVIGGTALGLTYKGSGDINGDGLSDIVWEDGSGNVSIWFVAGSLVTGTAVPASGVASAWVLKGVSDVTGDGIADLIWYNTTSSMVVVWIMNQSGAIASSSNVGYANANHIGSGGWQLRGVGDFNGDGRSDLLFINGNSSAIWQMSASATNAGTYYPPAVTSDLSLQGVGDFNGDGKSDLVWRSQSTGNLTTWWMNNATVVSSHTFSGPSADWILQGFADLNADQTSDIVWRSASTGTVSGWVMSALSGGVAWYASPGTMTTGRTLRGFGFFD